MRREFSLAAKIAIVNRASDAAYRIHCEKCGAWCKNRRDYEIDHVLPEAMRPAADKCAKLKPADGQLLCLRCHGAKTPKDVAEIALAVRREAYHLGVEKPGKQKLRSRKREKLPPYRPAAGTPALLRQGFVPAGDVANAVLNRLREGKKP